MAVWGSISAFLYRTESSKDWLYISDASGRESHIALPDAFDLNDRANASYVLASPTSLWIWSGILGKTTLRHYRLAGRNAHGLPTTATLESATSVGDDYTRPGELVRLASGGLLGIWHQYRQHEDRHLEVGWIHVTPSGAMTTTYSVAAPGTEGTPVATRWALVQHPADGSIWAFFKRDSYHEIGALHFTESETGIRLDWLNPHFIGREAGMHEPEGEYPYLTALADSGHSTIILAYQNNRYDLMYVTDGDGNLLNGSCRQASPQRLEPYFFAKRARVSMATITADGGKSFEDGGVYVERAQEFGLSVTDRLWLLYRRIDCETSSYNMLQRQGEVMLRYHDGEWSEPLILGKLDVDKEYYAASLFSSPHQPHFLMRLDDGLLHLFEAMPDS
jgi:hypothetical protein